MSTSSVPPPPPKPNAPRAPLPPPPPAARPAGQAGTTKTFTVERGKTSARGQMVCVYGPGGIGKTTLASLASKPLFIDVDNGSSFMDVARIADIQTWDEFLGALRSPVCNDFDTIVVDTLTKAEQLAVAHTLATVPKEKGQFAKSVEDYGYGKGYQHVYETFLTLFPVLDVHLRERRNVIMIAHECTMNVPNPAGEDWIRWEPMLQSPSSGKASIRLLVRNTVDHLLFVGYDVVTEDGKGRGSGSRAIHPTELPYFMAKSRSMRRSREFVETDRSFWSDLFSGENT